MPKDYVGQWFHSDTHQPAASRGVHWLVWYRRRHEIPEFPTAAVLGIFFSFAAKALFCHQRHTGRESGHYVMVAFTRPPSPEDDDSGLAEPFPLADLLCLLKCRDMSRKIWNFIITYWGTAFEEIFYEPQEYAPGFWRVLCSGVQCRRQ